MQVLLTVHFFAPQGHVAFSEETGDRIAWTKIEQLQRGKYEVVAFYDQKVKIVLYSSLVRITEVQSLLDQGTVVCTHFCLA